ncbi:MAG TPA: succinate dehydrogenase [Myxococcota bacterium]|nr:succinate dehydrogenase [Myxococcota bacterium]
MSDLGASLPKPARFLETSRTDTWWLEPLLVFLGLGFFIVYGTWSILNGANYVYGPYMSPLYGLEIYGSSPHALLGPKPAWWPGALPFSPAMLVAWAPAGFRFSCYYYRGAYYKAFWADPVSCTVGEPRASYLGERWFPLVMQNMHRYFLYGALALMFVLTYDVIEATQFEDGFGIGLGTILLAINAVLIGGYTFGCHSLRHLVGGRFNKLPRSFLGKSCYECVSAANRNHMKWAWASLIMVLVCDIYIRLCCAGVITDLRIL